MIEYERLDVPGHTHGERRTMVDATVMFRFYGNHTGAAAVAEAESRLMLLGGADIVDMRSRRPLPDPPDGDDVRYVGAQPFVPAGVRAADLALILPVVEDQITLTRDEQDAVVRLRAAIGGA